MTTSTKVHLALLLGNAFWGIGAVVGALGLSTTHPVAFLMIRQFLAGLLLLGLSSVISNTTITSAKSSADDDDAAAKLSKPIHHHHHRRKRYLVSFLLQAKQYYKIFALVGLTLFCSQFGFLIGITLAGPVTCSVWQPSQPIIMACLSILLGLERWSSVRMSGVAIAFCGCILMVLLAPSSSPSEEEENTANGASRKQPYSSTLFWIGNLLFLINCVGDPSFVIVSKRLLDSFSPLRITGYSYLVSASYMGIATLFSVLVLPSMIETIPESSVWISGSIIPPLAAIPALIWFVVFSAAGASALITWANQHATGTLVMSYTVLQPVSTLLLTVILLWIGAVPDCSTITSDGGGGGDGEQRSSSSSLCLVPPNWGTAIGMTGIGIGLLLIIWTEPKKSGSTTTTTTTSRDRSHKLTDTTILLPSNNNRAEKDMLLMI